MIIMRPAAMADLAQIERLAEASGPMVCTLPAHRRNLLDKVEQSLSALQSDVMMPAEESYFFVLEETATGQLLGTSAIVAQAGYLDPFYAYRNDVIVHSSRALKVHNRVHALTLTHALSDHSQLCSFFITPALRNTHLPQLLSLGRLLFIAQHPERFSQALLAVLPGIADKAGHSPFWEHVGRKFFGIDYNQVEYYNGTRNKTFIAELMPHHPLYVSLLNEEAQAVMGLVHPDAELQFEILSGDGFEADNFVEIFDAGPIVTARRNTLYSWQQSKVATVEIGMPEMTDQLGLVINDQLIGFRAIVTHIPAMNSSSFCLKPEHAEALKVDAGSRIRWLPLPEH
ncbi:arginine N-succinyltransferase [Tolumonas lignilytica]|uniref:arginine N-succinyltransferase n=1 Tax=Tolumonas lignilytica TaxID=1283284 RepID=UPI000466440D|nr:arginine N-succinyltransferase [Tolumonas lignilytica]